MFNPEEIEFRPSSIYSILTRLETVTENQLAQIGELAAKPKMTAVQEKKLMELIAKRDKKPELPVGAITYLQEIYDKEVYSIYEEISGKEIDKGLICEQDVLEILGDFLGVFLVKNETTFSNGFIRGTPDSFIGDMEIVVDAKASWNLRTFRNAELSKTYEWQLHSYMWLTGAKRALLGYGLVNTPEHLIQDEVRKKSWSKGLISDTSDEYQQMEDQIRLNMSFDRIPIKNRLKLFWIDRDEKKIEQIETRVKMARKELAKIHEQELNYQPFQNKTDLTIFGKKLINHG